MFPQPAYVYSVIDQKTKSLIFTSDPFIIVCCGVNNAFEFIANNQLVSSEFVHDAKKFNSLDQVNEFINMHGLAPDYVVDIMSNYVNKNKYFSVPKSYTTLDISKVNKTEEKDKKMIITKEFIDVVTPFHSKACSDENAYYSGNGNLIITEKKLQGVVIERKLETIPRCNRCFLIQHIGQELPNNLDLKINLSFEAKQPKFEIKAL